MAAPVIPQPLDGSNEQGRPAWEGCVQFATYTGVNCTHPPTAAAPLGPQAARRTRPPGTARVSARPAPRTEGQGPKRGVFAVGDAYGG